MVKSVSVPGKIQCRQAVFSLLAAALILMSLCLGTVFAAEGTDNSQKPAAGQHGSASQGKSVDTAQTPGAKTASIGTEALEAAGEKMKESADSFGKTAASVLGSWVNVELVQGIRRIDVLAFLVSLAIFFLVERLVSAWLRRVGRRAPEEAKGLPWKQPLTAAIQPPISIIILLYGTYVSLFPVYSRLPGKESSLVHAITVSLANIGGTFAAVWLVYRIVRAADLLLQSRLSESPKLVESMLRRCSGPIKLFIGLMLIRSVFPVIEEIPYLYPILTNLLSLVFVGTTAWLAAEIVYVASDYFVGGYILKGRNPLYIRKLQTQVQFLRRLVLLLIVLVAVASGMMVFDKVRQLGASILASAGIASVIIGLSAQRTLGNLIVGLQIAITQPIRIGDVVTVEKETGTVEEIKSTFAIISTWDQRSLIVPLTYFTEKQFQNLTLSSSELQGTVSIFVDYTVPVDKIRSELQSILQNSSNWDGRSGALSVANLKENSVELTAVMSASDPANLGSLRSEVREKILTFLQENFPAGLPRLRAELEIEGIGREGDGGSITLRGASEEDAKRGA